MWIPIGNGDFHPCSHDISTQHHILDGGFADFVQTVRRLQGAAVQEQSVAGDEGRECWAGVAGDPLSWRWCGNGCSGDADQSVDGVIVQHARWDRHVVQWTGDLCVQGSPGAFNVRTRH
jgi:hypothetical protein